MAGGGGADHRADVSTIRVLHDYRSEDDRSIQDGPMRGRVLRCPGRVCFEVGSSRLCSYFRIVFCWARGESDRSLVGSALANNRCHRGELVWSMSDSSEKRTHRPDCLLICFTVRASKLSRKTREDLSVLFILTQIG